jgi:hypothetical protein
MSPEQKLIDEAWEGRAGLNPSNAPEALRRAVEHVIAALDAGKLRVAEKHGGEWLTHQWVKKAVLLSFRLEDNRVMEGGATRYYDKVASKFDDFDFPAAGVRVVPPAMARRGAYIARNVVLMPSFVNIGAYIDEGTMVDTWATVGSCAQIGRNVHLSGGVGIGGVLEPLQANPVQRALHGRVHRPEHEDLRPGVRRGPVRARTRGVGGRARNYALRGPKLRPVLRRDRQEGRRPHPGEDQPERIAAGGLN